MTTSVEDRSGPPMGPTASAEWIVFGVAVSFGITIFLFVAFATGLV